MPENDEMPVVKHLALPAFAKRKVGPLPVYGWGIIGAGMVGGFWYLRRRNRADAPSALTATDYSGGYGTGGGFDLGGGDSQSPGSGNNGGGGSGGSGGSSPTPQPSYVPTPTPTPTPQTRPQPSYVPTPGQTQTPPAPAPSPSRPRAVPLSSPSPSPGASAGTGVPLAPVSGPAPGINIPQAWLKPGEFNVISSPGGTIRGLEGWSAWVQLPSGNWQQYVEGEYSAPGERLGLLPSGLSLPNGLTARPTPGAPSAA